MKNSQGAKLFGYQLTTSYANIIFPSDGGVIEMSTSEGMDEVYNSKIVDALLADEAQDRQAADEGLGSRIDAEAGRAAEAEDRLQAQIAGLQSAIDLEAETDTQVASDADCVQLETEYTNIRTGEKSRSSIALPTASGTTSGLMDSAMFGEFRDHRTEINRIKYLITAFGRTVVAAGLGSSPSQTAVTSAFQAIYYGDINPGDKVLDLDSNKLWVMDNAGTWIAISGGGGEIGLAGQSEPGLAKHSAIDGAVGYYVEGVGQVNGWSDLKAAVSANAANISSRLPLAGGTMAQAATIQWPNQTAGVRDLIYATVGDNDQAAIRAGATASNAGYLELATGDDASEPIYVSQYSGTVGTQNPHRRTALLDANGYMQLASWLHLGNGTEDGTSIGGVLVENGGRDGYVRRTSAANFKSQLGIPSLPLSTANGGTGANYADKSKLAYGIFQTSMPALSYVYGEASGAAGYRALSSFRQDLGIQSWIQTGLTAIDVAAGNSTLYVNEALRLAILSVHIVNPNNDIAGKVPFRWSSDYTPKSIVYLSLANLKETCVTAYISPAEKYGSYNCLRISTNVGSNANHNSTFRGCASFCY
ncbi:MAG: hypothetical protein LBH25_09545 [Fibromonadaceae bacterium]|nr:hypothetical protein [Fibromonadaceae bacterium]